MNDHRHAEAASVIKHAGLKVEPTAEEIADLAGRLIESEILACQSCLVDELRQCRADFGYEEIENLYAPTEDDPEESEPQEIYEWWLVSQALARDLREIGEPVLEALGSIWWGRTCTGQSIDCDPTMYQVALNLWSRTQ